MDPLGGEEVSVVNIEYEPDKRDPGRGELIFSFNLVPPSAWQEGFRQLVARRSDFVSMGGFSFARRSISI